MAFNNDFTHNKMRVSSSNHNIVNQQIKNSIQSGVSKQNFGETSCNLATLPEKAIYKRVDLMRKVPDMMIDDNELDIVSDMFSCAYNKAKLNKVDIDLIKNLLLLSFYPFRRYGVFNPKGIIFGLGGIDFSKKPQIIKFGRKTYEDAKSNYKMSLSELGLSDTSRLNGLKNDGVFMYGRYITSANQYKNNTQKRKNKRQEYALYNKLIQIDIDAITSMNEIIKACSDSSKFKTLYKWMKFNGVPVVTLKNWFTIMGHVAGVPQIRTYITPELENDTPTDADFPAPIKGGKYNKKRMQCRTQHKKRKQRKMTRHAS
jgi:hypothetical protein